jgi:hypothetical protein
MPKVYLFFFFLIFNQLAKSQPLEVMEYCRQLNELNNRVTSGTVNRKLAVTQFHLLIQKLKSRTTIQSNARWVFPLMGYSANAIGGTHGNGYTDKGYNYLDGNKHTAHPAQDIFITDHNQDDLDDRTHQPVSVLAVTDGIVIACTNQWNQSSSLRGGRYIWLYHPSLNMLTYYAHNRHILVGVGDVIKQGQKIAEVGRTGFNAFKKRSPTHLHFSSFRLNNALPRPFNSYITLTKAKQL